MADQIILNVWAVAVGLIVLVAIVLGGATLKNIIVSNVDEGDSKTILIIQLLTTTLGLVTAAVILITLPFAAIQVIIAFLEWLSP